MSVAALARRISQFGFDLLGSEFALDARMHLPVRLSNTRWSLMWQRDDRNASFIIDNPPRIIDYMTLLEQKEYSFLMYDGAIVQISYIFEGKKINQHRLLYYPCPFLVEISLIDEHHMSLSDLIRYIYMENIENNVAFRSPIRFDYAPTAVANFHPASHITINAHNCCIPLRAPMCFDQFIKFVIENFYPSILKEQKIMSAILEKYEEECLSEHDRGRIHMTW